MKFVLPSVLLLFLALLPCTAVPAEAALLTLSSSGDGVFVLHGAGLADVGGIDATVSYDPTALANPRVVQGGLVSGGTMAANTNYSPGAVRIGILTPRGVTGSGIVATINFDRRGAGGGKVYSFNAVMINAKGNPLPVQTRIINPAEETASLDSTAAAGQSAASSQASTESDETAESGPGQRYLGPSTISIPGEAEEPPIRSGAADSPPEQPSPEAEAGQPREATADTSAGRRNPDVEAAADTSETRHTAHTSTLDRFREFKGRKSPKSLIALFDATSMPGVRQEPDVALSDGKTKIKISIRNPFTGNDSPSFALRGASLISLKADGNGWVIETLPDRKVHEASLTVLGNGQRIEIPLTVAPPIDSGKGPTGGPDNAAFARFLKNRGTDKAPRFDLNGDGVRNYLDDYIFTANHIAKRGSKSGKQ